MSEELKYENYWSKLDSTHDYHPANRFRYKLVRKFVNSYLNDGDEILDVGCGSGVLIEKISKWNGNLKLTGIDIAETEVKKATNLYPQHTFKTLNFERDTYRNKKFDGIICSEVIEHIPNDEIFLQNIYKNLKEGGFLYITTQSGPRYRMDREILGHLRHYKLTELESKLIGSGFTVVESRHEGFPVINLQKILVDRNFDLIIKKIEKQTTKISSLSKIALTFLYVIMLVVRIPGYKKGPQLIVVATRNSDV